jgi:hypothetical protein
MKWNLGGSIYGRSSLKIAHLSRSINKHGHHRQFLNGSRQNEQPLERTFHRCFLSSFTSFG